MIFAPRLFVMFATVALLTGCATKQKPIALGSANVACSMPTSKEQLKFELGDAGSPIVWGHVNEHGPYPFVLDNGASNTTINESTVRKTGLQREPGSEQGQGIGGAVEVLLYRAKTIRVGPLNAQDVVVPVVPSPQFDSHPVVGLAGVDLIGDRIALWDFPAKQVSFYASGQQEWNEQCWTALSSTWQRPWRILIPLKVDGVEGLAMIDTGIQQTTINAEFARRLRIGQANGPAVVIAGEVSGVDGRALPRTAATVGNVQLGEWKWSERRVHVVELPLFNRLGDSNQPMMILGADWLVDQRFAIDYSAQKVWWGKPH